jgi:NAD(P)-dependent dehydrogenase (short-subunit alcohol dehydrogenase family)
MDINGAVALVTGANRGLGQAFARELVRRGAATVYGGARHPEAVTEPGVTGTRTREAKASLPRDHEVLYPPLEQFWDAAVAAHG